MACSCEIWMPKASERKIHERALDETRRSSRLCPGTNSGRRHEDREGRMVRPVLTVWYSTNVILGHRARVICSQRVDACKNATVLLSTLISSSYGEPVHKQGDDLDVRLFRHMHSNDTLHIIIFNLQQFYMAHSRGVYTPKSGTLSLYPRRPPSVSCNRCWHVGAPSVQARIPADFLSVVTTTVPNSYHPSKD